MRHERRFLQAEGHLDKLVVVPGVAFSGAVIHVIRDVGSGVEEDPAAWIIIDRTGGRMEGGGRPPASGDRTPWRIIYPSSPV